MTCNIKIGSYVFDSIKMAKISSSYETLTNTAEIELPRKVSWKGKNIYLGESGLLKKGDQITIQLGYDDDLKTVFKGYLTKISADTPVKIEAEDDMWLLKKIDFKKAYRTVKLDELLKDMLPATVQYKAVDTTLGSFRIRSATVAKVLETIQSDYGLYSFFRNGILYSGLPFWAENAKKFTFKFGRNIISDKLEYIKGEDVQIKIKAISLLTDNKKIEVEVGDPDGELRTLHQYNMSESELKKWAEGEIDRLRYDGFRGTFVAFGEPCVDQGDIVKLIDEDYPEKNGEYLIKRVDKVFSENGYRQTIELGRAVA